MYCLHLLQTCSTSFVQLQKYVRQAQGQKLKFKFIFHFTETKIDKFHHSYHIIQKIPATKCVIKPDFLFNLVTDCCLQWGQKIDTGSLPTAIFWLTIIIATKRKKNFLCENYLKFVENHTLMSRLHRCWHGWLLLLESLIHLIWHYSWSKIAVHRRCCRS